MKRHNLKKIIFGNVSLKIISLILGYSFWHAMSYNHNVNLWLAVPLCFHDVPENLEMQSPETIKINITGKRTDIYALDQKNLAVHIDGHYLQPGKNHLTITGETLFLPNTIKVIHYKPSNVTIDVHIKNSPSLLI